MGSPDRGGSMPESRAWGWWGAVVGSVSGQGQGQSGDNLGHHPGFKTFSLLEGKIPIVQQSRAAPEKPPDLACLFGAPFKLWLHETGLHPLKS